MRNEGASTLSMTQENIWNLTRLEVGMKKKEVRSIMHAPYKTQIIEHDDVTYEVWFYVTRPTALDQPRLVRLNVTPLIFECGYLMGWGFDIYDRALCNRCIIPDYCHYPRVQEETTPARKKSLEKTIEEFETTLLSANDSSPYYLEEEEEHECEECKPKKPLNSEDEQMLDEANEQNFNFW